MAARTLSRLLSILVCGIACFYSEFSLAQEESASEPAAASRPTADALAKSAGFWKESRQTEEGEKLLAYEWRRYAAGLDAVVHAYFRVDPESKEVSQIDMRYFGVRGDQGQVHGVVVSSTGMVVEILGKTTDNGMFAHGQGVLPGGGRIAADIRSQLHDEQHVTTTFTHMISPSDDEEEYVQRLEKLDYASPQEFFEGEGLVFEEIRSREPAAGLSPLSHFLGRWVVADEEGEPQLTVNTSYRVGRRWLFERWRFAGGQGGLNISGVDPSSGRLALWTIAPGFIGRVGRWDVLSDRSLGQVQATARLVRTFIGNDTFAAYWQDLRGGTFVDREQGGYVARRTSRPPTTQQRP